MKNVLASAWASRDGKGKTPSRVRAGRRRRGLPYLLIGVLLVVACAAAGVFIVTNLGNRESVLALARPVVVGHTLTAQDLKQVTVASGSEVNPLLASELSTVLGQSAAYSLPAGSLVTPSVLGTPQLPPAGKAIAAVGLKDGQFPPDLSPGANVAVIATPTQNPASGTSTGQTATWRAVVTGIAPGQNGTATVVSLQLSESDAMAVASALAGQLSLVALAGGDH